MFEMLVPAVLSLLSCIIAFSLLAAQRRGASSPRAGSAALRQDLSRLPQGFVFTSPVTYRVLLSASGFVTMRSVRVGKWSEWLQHSLMKCG